MSAEEQYREHLAGIANSLDELVDGIRELADAMKAIRGILPEQEHKDHERACRVCGCTQYNACVVASTGGPCCWIEDDLCSACFDKNHPAVR